MIQVYEKNGLFIIQNTITDIIYPNLTKQEAINLLVELGRTSDRVDNAIKDFNENNFQYESLEVDKTRLKYLQQQLADYEKKLEQSNNTIDHQSSLILEQNEFIKAYNQQLVEKDKRIDELEQEREFMLDEVKNRGTCGLCEKLEEKAINVLRDKLKEKDQEIERLKANQTPTRKRLTPKNWDKYNLADKLRYRNSQVKEALIRFSNMNEMEDVLRSQLKDQCHQICEKIREKLKKCATPTCGTYIVYYEAKNVDDTLDQIEKGE